jgi:hypothetical protein
VRQKSYYLTLILIIDFNKKKSFFLIVYKQNFLENCNPKMDCDKQVNLFSGKKETFVA